MEKLNSKLELLMVCVDYSDFLEITLPINKEFFDYILVITTAFDKETKKICKQNNVDYIETNLFYKNGELFNKGLGLSSGFKHLKHKDWVILMDADIVLPQNFKDNLNVNNLDINTLYGVGRTFIWTYKDWLDYENEIKKESDFETIPGWGCGFFQLFNLNNKIAKSYPLDELYPEGNVNSDIIFLKKWHPDVKNVGKLPINVIHLGGHGIAHNSRKYSRIEEFKKPFKEQSNLSNNLMYK